MKLAFLFLFKPGSFRRSITHLWAVAVLCALTHTAHAATYYLDNNSTTAGFGTAGGTWAAPTLNLWSTDSTGVAAPGASITTTTSDALHFGTATDGLTAGTITLSGTVSANSLTFGSASGAITLSGGVVNIGGATPTITVNNTTNTISRLSGTGGLTKAGSGTLILQAPGIAANARPGPSGSVVVNAGVLRYETTTGDPDLSGSFAINNGSTLQINGAGLRTLHNGSTFTYGATGGGTVTIDNANPILNNSTFTTTGGAQNTLNGTATFNGQGNNVTFNVATGAGPVGLAVASNLGNLKLIKDGAGVMTLTNVGNALSTGIQINASGGTLEVASAGRLNSGSYAGAISIGASATLSYNSTATQALSGVISGAGALTKSNSSALTLSGASANTYSGATTVNGGSLILAKTAGVDAIAGNLIIGDGTGTDIVQLTNSNQIADTSVITFNGSGANAGILRLNNQSETLAGLSSTGGAGIVENESGSASTGTLTVNIASGSQSFSGILRNGDGTGTDGTLALTKLGNGTQVLTGANTYTGGSTITGGALEVNNTSGSGTGSGTLTVNSTLKGDGSITTAANNFVYINGTLQVGQTGSTLGQDFSLTTSGTGSTVLGISSSLELDLWSTTGADQSGTLAAADMLRLFGDVSIAGTSLLKLGNPNALTFQAGDIFRVFDWTGLGTRTGTFTEDFSAISLAPGTYIDTTNLYSLGTISIMSIPEPSRALLLVSGLAGLLLRRRRR